MAKTHQGTSAEAAAEMRRDADAAAAADASGRRRRRLGVRFVAGRQFAAGVALALVGALLRFVAAVERESANVLPSFTEFFLVLLDST